MAKSSIIGQSITWYVVSYGYEYDFERARRTGGSARYRVEKVDATRTGVVWSAGPVSGTMWVIPDERAQDEGYAVCVQVNDAGVHRMRPNDVERSTIAWQRMEMAVIQNRHYRRAAHEYAHTGATDVRVVAA